MSGASLQAAIDSLYQLVVVEGKKTSTKRLSILADFCIAELDARGLHGAEAEVTIPAGGRPKDWDIAWKWAGKYRLVISLKSILKNLPGTVPNRIDDAMGETTSIQLYSPEVVTGYLMLIDGQNDIVSDKHGCTWVQLLRSRLENLSGRRAPYWSPGTFEAFAVAEVNFAEGPILVSGRDSVGVMFDTLVNETMRRNPGIKDD